MPSIEGAPWWAKIFSTLVSQGGLFYAQYVLKDSSAAPIYTLLVACLQCVQGSVAAYGLSVWKAASGAIASVSSSMRGSRSNLAVYAPPPAPVAAPPTPAGGDGPGGPTP